MWGLYENALKPFTPVTPTAMIDDRPASQADDDDDDGGPIFYPIPTRFEVELDVLLETLGIDHAADDDHDDQPSRP